jgi:glycosyltransferase involved in cell wall biosynthesis
MTDNPIRAVDCSVVMPVGIRVDDLETLVSEVDVALKSTNLRFEIIVVLDGQMDQHLSVLREVAEYNERLRVIELARQFGESAALAAGFDAARGEKILTWPAYYQIDPEELPKLIEEMESGSSDMLVAVRNRGGVSVDTFRRRAFHALFRVTSGMRFRDLGCGVRIFDSRVAAEIPLYGDQHRFFPALARKRGFRVREVELKQSVKDIFRGRYRLREYLHRFLDVLTVFFLVRFTKKPLRFFGTVGFLVASFGALFTLVLVVQRLFFGIGLAERPALIIAALLIVLGVQVFALGLIGELIIFTHASNMKEYAIRQIIQNGVSHVPDSRAPDPRAKQQEITDSSASPSR